MSESTTPVVHEHSLVPVLLSLVVRAAAVTLGRHIFVRRGVWAEDWLLRHEATHVAQYAELGLLGFGWAYASDFVRAWWVLRDRAAAYRAIRLEQEARTWEAGPAPWWAVGNLRTPGAWRELPQPERIRG